MKIEPGGSILKGVVWLSLVDILLPLLFPEETDAQKMGQLSLIPDNPKECDIATIEWTQPFQVPCSVDILNTSDPSQAIIFHTTAFPPTSTVDWLVNATAGVSLELVIAPIAQEQDTGATPSPLTTHFTVGAGQTSCIAPSPGTIPSSSATLSTIPDPSHITSSEASAGMGGLVSSMERLSTESPNTMTSSLIPSKATSFPPDISSSSTTSGSRNGLYSGMIAGVAAGSIAVIALVIVTRYLTLRRKRTDATTTGSQGQVLMASHCLSCFRWLCSKVQSLGIATFKTISRSNDSNGTGRGEERFDCIANSGGSLGAQAFLMEPSELNGVFYTSLSHQQGVSGGNAPEKSLREWRGGTVATSALNRLQERTDIPDAEAPISSGHRTGHQGAHVFRYETDGGVRLAGGRPGEAAVQVYDSDEHSTSEGSTLPPPYSSDFGDSDTQ